MWLPYRLAKLSKVPLVGLIGLIVFLLFISGHSEEGALAQQASQRARQVMLIEASSIVKGLGVEEGEEAVGEGNVVGWRVLFFMWVGSGEIDRMVAAENSWAGNLPENVKVIYFTTPADALELTQHQFKHRVHVLMNATRTYPPQSVMFEALKYISENLANQFDFFARIDSDNYVNVPKLLSVVADLKPTDKHYFGAPGRGRPDVAKKIGLEADYCLGGSGIFMSQATVLGFRGKVDECRANVATAHEDTELGRCVWRTSQVSCQLPGYEPVVLRKMFYNIYLQVLSAKGKLASGLPINLPSPAIEAIVVHPVRLVPEFFRLAFLHRHSLRPMQTQLAPYTNEKFIYRTACVHNVVAQSLLMCPLDATIRTCPWRKMRECPSPAVAKLQLYAAAWPIHIPMFSFATRDLEELSLPCLNNELRLQGVPSERLPITLQPRPMPALKSENDPAFVKELLAFREIVVHAIENELDRVMILQGRVLSHRQLNERMSVLLTDQRCSGHLFSEQEGGVLVLTPTITRLKALMTTIVQEDRDMMSSVCYSAPYNLTSAYAAIYHRITFSPMLKYIDTNFANITSLQSVILHLIDEGFIVRMASPHIFTHPLLGSFADDVASQDEFPCRCGLCAP
eukprot:m.11242 g.11242  ORF g.11242 m.11242 type:complete len:626 (+) comp5752_c0_seq1:130-2007(+)